MDGYGNDVNEAFAELLNSMREGGEGDIDEALAALGYWLSTVRAAPPDFSDPRVQAALGIPRWVSHGANDPPQPGLYLRYGRLPQGFGEGFLGACFHCAGSCPPGAEGWGWLCGPLPLPPGYRDAPAAGRSGP